MILGGTQSAFAQSASAIMTEWIGSRKKVSLWLDLKIGREVETLEIIQAMKSKRAFRSSVILGLKIIHELRQGRVDTLLREFPNIGEMLQVKAAPPPVDGGGQLDEINAKLELILASQKPNGGYEMASQPLTTGKTLGGFKPLPAPTFTEDDDPLPVPLKPSANQDSAFNFVTALKNMQ